MVSARRGWVSCLICVGLAVADGGRAASAVDKAPQLQETYQRWLASVELLITEEEKAAFIELEKDYQRDAFIEQFWRVRDPYPSTARNEFKERWMARVDEVRYRFGELRDERSRVFLLNGSPDALVEIRCTDLWPAEAWYYKRAETIRSEIGLLFYQHWGTGPYRIWFPQDGFNVLRRFPGATERLSCSIPQMEALRAVMAMVRALGNMGFMGLTNRLQTPPKPAVGEWIATFNAYSTDLPAGAGTFSADLQIDYPNRHQNRTVVQSILAVDTAEVEASKLTESGSYNLVLTGEVLRDDTLFENFRYKFNLSANEIVGQTIPLVFERYLRPGEYSLLLKLEDLNSQKFFVTRRQIVVPQVEYTPELPEDSETARLLAEANEAISTGLTTLKIVEPRDEMPTGLLRVDTLTTGDEISSVAFLLDGKPVLTKRTPPFTVELDLGSLPRMRALTAVAYDSSGREVARDEKQLNASSHRFDVRLVEPRPGETYHRSLRAEAAVQVPDGKAVERLEFYLNEDLLATLYQPPYTQAILLPDEEQMAYVRVVAYQPDGSFTEDTVFVNAPEYLENVEVQFVELYIAVLDRSKRPVQGLPQADFSVVEDGVEQEPRRFDRVSNLPIHAGILIDVSASMKERLETAQSAALQFFNEAVTARDRAALITFNDHPNLAVKFTNDLDSLAGGLAGLKAERGTALYDSLIFALYYFNGIKGQRALIVLSDGEDEGSKFSFDDTLEYARRAGVAIYTIGLSLPHKRDVRRKLTRLAEETGGRSFFLQGIDELSAVYDTIQQELRSRYYLAYQSSNTSDDESFRSIEVRLARSGLEAKTLRGYYP